MTETVEGFHNLLDSTSMAKHEKTKLIEIELAYMPHQALVRLTADMIWHIDTLAKRVTEIERKMKDG